MNFIVCEFTLKEAIVYFSLEDITINFFFKETLTEKRFLSYC
jgi:hypothetical protein